MRSRNEQQQKRPLGVMVSERKLETEPSAVKLAKKFGFYAAGSTPCALACVQWLRQRPEVVKAMAQHPAKRRVTNPVTAECHALDSALSAMSFREVAELRLAWLMHTANRVY